MTAFGTIEIAVKAVKQGAYDFLTKPFDTDHLLVLIKRALDATRIATENILLKEEFADRFGLAQDHREKRGRSRRSRPRSRKWRLRTRRC